MNTDIETLRDYLETNDVIVQYEKGGICAFWKSKSFPLITINTNVRGNNRLYVMLHEAGHYMNWTKQLDQDMLLEEYTAWENGIQLAKNLNIFIDEKKYWGYANRALNSYKRYYLKNAS
jgi:Zn-dependent peptidase ImmA (M78 family)